MKVCLEFVLELFYLVDRLIMVWMLGGIKDMCNRYIDDILIFCLCVSSI